MQRRYDQMSRNGSLHRYGCRLLISNLTDHNDIRVLTQNGTQRRREGQVRLIINLHLIDSVDIRLYRILYGDDINIFFI